VQTYTGLPVENRGSNDEFNGEFGANFGDNQTLQSNPNRRAAAFGLRYAGTRLLSHVILHHELRPGEFREMAAFRH